MLLNFEVVGFFYLRKKTLHVISILTRSQIFFFFLCLGKTYDYNWTWITKAEGVKKPHHVHLRDGVQTLDLNVHSHRNRRACKKMETEAEVLLLFSASLYLFRGNMTPGGSVAITTESDWSFRESVFPPRRGHRPTLCSIGILLLSSFSAFLAFFQRRANRVRPGRVRRGGC